RDREKRGRVEHEPCAANEHFDVGVEVGRPERRISTVVDAGDEARGIIEGAAAGDHRMREIPAYAHAVAQRVERGSRAVGRTDLEPAVLIDPITHRPHLAVTGRNLPEGVPSALRKEVGLAIPARIQVAQRLYRQQRRRFRNDLRRVDDPMRNVDTRLIPRNDAAGTAGNEYGPKGKSSNFSSTTSWRSVFAACTLSRKSASPLAS